MSRPASIHSPRGDDPGISPADHSSTTRDGPGKGSSDTEAQLADLVGRDVSALSIERLVPEDSYIRDLLRSRQFEDIDIRRISETV